MKAGGFSHTQKKEYVRYRCKNSGIGSGDFCPTPVNNLPVDTSEKLIFIHIRSGIFSLKMP